MADSERKWDRRFQCTVSALKTSIAPTAVFTLLTLKLKCEREQWIHFASWEAQVGELALAVEPKAGSLDSMARESGTDVASSYLHLL